MTSFNAVDLDVLLEDGPLLAVNKPAGWLVQAPPDVPSLESTVKRWLAEKYQKPAGVYLGVPHRLDRPVSGAIVFAKNSKAAARLAEQFRQREVRKTYWAILEGLLPEKHGTLADWLEKVPDQPRVEIAAAGAAEAREAILSYRTLAEIVVPSTGTPASLVEIELQTGRMHQIRVQFASRGCPVAGDSTYGAALLEETCSRGRFEERIALHARSISLKHPVRYDDLTITAPLPGFWDAFQLPPI